MAIFWVLFFKIIPLYLMIGLGYIAARFLGAQKETVARILIYIIAPAVVFYGTATTTLDAANLSMPILYFSVACVLCLLFLQIGKRVYGADRTKNVLAFAAGTGNVGYFGLPVALAFFDGSVFGLAVMTLLGSMLYEFTLGFFIVANGSYDFKASVAKVVKLPPLYAFVAGLAVNISQINLGAVIPTLDYFKAAYILLGMMLVGMGLAAASLKSFDRKFVSLAFLARFAVWPAVIAAVIFADTHWAHIYSANAYRVIILMSVVPLAANTVAYATEFKTCPDKAAIAVFLSTLFALLYIPLVVGLFLG
ncbi:MAG: AEC family transporter [Candidatus Pacebacteria bacterium]|nr:AEC family transporter [Candidatus Paceibacterota bacterium]